MNKLLLLCLLILLFLVPSLAVQAQEEEKSIVFDDIEWKDIHNAELLQKRRQFGNMSVEQIDGYITDYRVGFIDTFNFELWRYEDLFASIVNNWAFLCQAIWVLHPIHVGILFVAR